MRCNDNYFEDSYYAIKGDKTKKWGFLLSPLPLIFNLFFNTLRHFLA